MKTCKDCIHYDCCHYHITEETNMTINECSTGFLGKDDVVLVVHGEWVEHGNWWGHIEYECSACKGQTFDASEFAYCPHCGARMDGGNN